MGATPVSLRNVHALNQLEYQIGVRPSTLCRTMKSGKTRGAFLVVEGLDGSGTTTQVRLISAHLRELGFRTWTTREPSSGPLGLALREAIEGREVMTPETLSLGFAADRLHHMFREGG